MNHHREWVRFHARIWRVTGTFWCQCFSIDGTRSFVCFRSCLTSWKVFRIADKESCSSFEDLGRLWGLGGGDCSGSLRRPCFVLERDLERERWRFLLVADEPEKIFPEREAYLPYKRKNDSKRAKASRDTAKNMKKGGKRTHLPVVVRSTREKMTGSCQRSICDRRELWYYVMYDFFSYPGGTALFSFILDALKSGS